MRTVTPRLWLPVVLILAFGAYIAPRMNSTISYDEALTFYWYARSPIDALFRYTLPNNHLINSFFTWASTAYFGRSEFAIRLPAFFVCMMAVAAMFRLTERLWGRGAAVGAVIMLATSAGFVEQGTFSRGYVWSILFGALLLMMVLFRRLPGYPAMLFSALLMMAMPTMALLIGGIGLWSLRYKRQAAAPLITGTLIGSAFYGEAIVMGKMAHFTDRFGWYNFGELWVDAYNALFYKSPIALVGTVVFSLMGLYALRTKPRLLTLFALIIGIPLVITPLQLIFTGKLMYARLYLYLIVVLAPLMAFGVVTIFKRYAPLVLGVWLAVVGWGLIYREPVRDPVFEIIAEIRDRVTPGEESVLIGCCLDSQVEYYLYEEMWLFYPYDRERLYIIPAHVDTLPRILAVYDLEAECIRADWLDYEVYECVNMAVNEQPEGE